jgi:Neutral/alkaline non-lysosomal ceramidase, C-terminal
LRGPPTHTPTTLRQLRNMACSVTKAPLLSLDLVCLLYICGVTQTPTVRKITDTLDAYIDKYTGLVPYLADYATTGAEPPSDPAPPDLSSQATSSLVGRFYPGLITLTLPSALLQKPVFFDSPVPGHGFGDVLIDVPARSVFKAGQTVWARFVGASPRVCEASSSYRHIG